MYQALYRKWRPLTFDDVISQTHITTILKNEINNSRIGHAYLFTGTRGSGKTSCAKIFAKAVNCLSPKNGNPCLECECCKGIQNESIVDVIEMDAASNTGVDYIRELREESNFTPTVCKYRVYIIDEVHMLTTNAFNAFLKLLEEPPSHVIFILATTEVHKIPATILSRCQRFDFKRITPEAIKQRIIYISENEDFSIESDAAQLIARLADGGMRDALSLLEQCVSFSNNIGVETVCNAAGIPSIEHLFAISDAILENQPSKALEIIDTLYQNSKDLERLCEELINFFRNIMIINTTINQKDIEHLIIGADIEINKLVEVSKKYKLTETIQHLMTLEQCIENMSRSLNKRIATEMCIIKMCSPNSSVVDEKLIKRVEAVENALNSINLNQQNTVSVQPKKSETVSQAQTAPPQQNIDFSKFQKVDCWAEILETLSELDKPLHGIIQNAAAFEFENLFAIVSSNNLLSGMLKKDGASIRLSEAIYKHTGKKYRILLRPQKEIKNEQNNKIDNLIDDLKNNDIDIKIRS